MWRRLSGVPADDNLGPYIRFCLWICLVLEYLVEVLCSDFLLRHGLTVEDVKSQRHASQRNFIEVQQRAPQVFGIDDPLCPLLPVLRQHGAVLLNNLDPVVLRAIMACCKHHCLKSCNFGTYRDKQTDSECTSLKCLRFSTEACGTVLQRLLWDRKVSLSFVD